MCSCFWIGLVLTAPLGAGRSPDVERESKRLQGKWTQVSVEADGKVVADKADPPKVTVTVDADRWTERATGAGADEVATIRLDPAKDPRHIDLTYPGEKALPGLYRLEGDTLTVALPFPFEGDASKVGVRPTGFRTRPGDPFVVIVYKRMTP